MPTNGDQVFFAQGNVTVTRTRFISQGNMYVMASISSCRTRYTEEQDSGKKLQRNLAIIASTVSR